MSVSDAGAYVYWSDHGSFFTGTGTTLGRANVDGTGVNTSLVTGASQPAGMAVDESHVYWADGTSIGRANLDGSGSNPDFISTGTAVADVATDGTYIWWTDASRYVGRANIDGTGTPSAHCIDAGVSSQPAGLAVAAAGMIYLGEANQIARVVDACGATSTPLATISPSPTVPPLGLAVANGYVYFAVTSGGSGAIDRVLTSGGTPQAYVAGLGFPTGVAIDGTYIYWADNSAQEIGRAPLADPANPQLNFISANAGPLGIAVDSGIDPTTTSVSCTPASAAPGSITACTATVGDGASSAAASGVVVFSGNSATSFIGGSSSCTLSPDGSGRMSCVVGAVPTVAGTAPITASYQGDAAHAKSQGTTNVCVGTTAQCSPSTLLPPPTTTTPKPRCVVPKVAGKSLAAAEKLIRRARCAIGKITRPKAHKRQKLQKLTVSRTKPTAGTRVPPGTKVAIVLVHTHKPPSNRK
jgi:hypothetical protein